MDSTHLPATPPTDRRPSFEVRFFGATDIQGADGGRRLLEQPKLLSLFAYLMLARPRGFHRRDRLVGMFWPEQTEGRARASLRDALRSLREALGPAAVLRRGDTDVAIDPQHVWCDVYEFERAAASGYFARALELYQGPLLQGIFGETSAVEHWLEEERETMRAAAADAAWTLAERYETSTDLTSAARWARKAARLSRADERRIRRVMNLLDRAGDGAGAIAVYDEFARHLDREFELEPSAETRALAQAIRERR